MVVTDHNQPVFCNGIVIFRFKIKVFDVRTTEMEESLYRYYMG